MPDPILIIMLVLVVGMFWFTGRNARKRQKEMADLRESLQPGLQVMTASGYVGTVVSVDGDLVTLESEDGARTKWVAAAIAKPYEASPAVGTVETAASPEDAPQGSATTGFVVPDNISSLITKPGDDPAAGFNDSKSTREDKTDENK
ncbi:preprotein translocase subunit YajC [Populibacterium corticicola]|uniref:Preprotein translocase subunit YajC n=1 Tax=Populibacterium corticicola TaxID=1812826 RepID=A0ABW5XAE8_9MICO